MSARLTLTAPNVFFDKALLVASLGLLVIGLVLIVRFN